MSRANRTQINAFQQLLPHLCELGVHSLALATPQPAQLLRAYYHTHKPHMILIDEPYTACTCAWIRGMEASLCRGLGKID